MVATNIGQLTLAEFLDLPDTEPASEYINGQIIQKPMPKTRHSRLQGKLIGAINTVAEDEQIAYAFPELRCTFGGRSIVPDIAVLLWQNIRVNAEGEPLDDVMIPPDWVIEILSPDQSANRVTGNILHCLKHGSKMGWLLDPDDRSVMVLEPNQPPELVSGDQPIPAIAGLPVELTAAQLFGWLKMKR
ncbi:MAG: Uma2 family endonuclease [Cyanobacteria bacterium P01_F01_bin.150]